MSSKSSFFSKTGIDPTLQTAWQDLVNGAQTSAAEAAASATAAASAEAAVSDSASAAATSASDAAASKTSADADATAAASSASDAATSATAAASSATASSISATSAAVSAATVPAPSTDDGKQQILRVNSSKTAYELRDPSQVWQDILTGGNGRGAIDGRSDLGFGSSLVGPLTKYPTRTILTSGSGTYSVPSGATRLVVRMVGGGGGGGGASSTVTVSGSSGGTTTFNGVNAIGGEGAQQQLGGSGTTSGTGVASYRCLGNCGESAYYNAVSGIPASGGGGGGPFGGGTVGQPRPSTGLDGNPAPNNSGAGGGGAINNQGSFTQSSAGGQAGEYVELVITSPSSSYSYAVGAGGSPGSSTNSGGAGGSGVIIIDEFYS